MSAEAAVAAADDAAEDVATAATGESDALLLAAVATPEVEHPRRMLDRYEVIAEVARGGMGTVLLARLEGAGGFERLMAIKLMHEHLAQDGAFVAMLLDEARTAANIHHPNAVGIADVAKSEVGYYLVMNYVEGFTLADLLGHPALEPRERIRLGLRVLVDACRGLHAAHTTKDAHGRPLDIVHRDVSPQNILIGLDGVGRMIDFGIALAASRMTASRPGMLKGKPSYMAPEQVQSEPTDARADVFALGIVCWEILVGWQLFAADLDVATLLQVISSAIPRPKSLQPLVPDALDEVAMKALERPIARRTHDARALAAGIEAAAMPAGLIATNQEVSDAVEHLFSEEIAAKQEAIRRHLAASKGEKKPLLPGQLSLVPRLYERQAARSGHLGGGRGSQSGVRERGHDPQVATRLATPAVGGTTSLPGATSEAAPLAPRRTPWLGIAIGVVGVIALLTAIGMSLGLVSGAREADAGAGGAGSAQAQAVGAGEAEAEAEAEAETETETETEAETAAETGTEAEPATEAATATATEAATEAEAETAAPSATGRAGGRHRTRPPAVEAAPVDPPPPPPRETVETNPYLTR